MSWLALVDDQGVTQTWTLGADETFEFKNGDRIYEEFDEDNGPGGVRFTRIPNGWDLSLQLLADGDNAQSIIAFINESRDNRGNPSLRNPYLARLLYGPIPGEEDKTICECFEFVYAAIDKHGLIRFHAAELSQQRVVLA